MRAGRFTFLLPPAEKLDHQCLITTLFSGSEFVALETIVSAPLKHLNSPQVWNPSNDSNGFAHLPSYSHKIQENLPYNGNSIVLGLVF